MKTILQIVVGIAAIVLAYLLYNSMMEPIRFNKEVDARTSLVVQRLKNIRELEIAYKDRYGKFTGSFDTLINFYKFDSLKIVRQVGSWDDSIAVAKKLVYSDTILVAVKDTLLRKITFSIDSIKQVPNVGTQFELAALMYMSSSGIYIPLFEARAHNRVYLKGLDVQLIVNLSDEQEKKSQYAGLKVGSIDQPNNNAGNWKEEIF